MRSIIGPFAKQGNSPTFKCIEQEGRHLVQTNVNN